MKQSVLIGVSGIVGIVLLGITCSPQSADPSEIDTVLDFSTSPDSFTTYAGAVDTLFFTLDHSSDVAYTLSCNPALDSTELHFAGSTDNDTSRVYFEPNQPGNYIVTLLAEVGTHSTTATVDISVLPSFTPFAVPHPDTIAAGGEPDTFIYILSPEQVAEGMQISVVVDESVLCGTMMVVPGGDDSLLIVVNSPYAGPLIFYVVTANETFSDTVTRTLTFIDEISSVWFGESDSLEATAGVNKQIPYPAGNDDVPLESEYTFYGELEAFERRQVDTRTERAFFTTARGTVLSGYCGTVKRLDTHTEG